MNRQLCKIIVTIDVRIDHGKGCITQQVQGIGDAAGCFQCNFFGFGNLRVTDTPPKLTFSGIGIYRPALFQHITPGTVAPLAPLLRAQIALNKVSGEHYTGRWVDVGTPQRLQQLDNVLHTTHNTTHA